MPIYQVKSIIDGQPTFEKKLNEILAELKIGGAIELLTPLEYITERQRRWYKGVALPQLVKNDENGETVEWWDAEVKRECGGLKYLKKEIFFIEDTMGQRYGVGRLTTKGVGRKNMTNFIEEFLSKSMVKGWNISPPDADLRKEK
jgi:hypothetical protein